MQPPRRLHAAATSRRSFAALRPLLCSWPSLPSGLHAPCALSRLATGRTRAALRRRRSAALRPGADRRITRKAAGGSWADTFTPPFTRRALRPARCADSALSPARPRPYAWEGRSRWPSTPRSPMVRWSTPPDSVGGLALLARGGAEGSARGPRPTRASLAPRRACPAPAFGPHSVKLSLLSLSISCEPVHASCGLCVGCTYRMCDFRAVALFSVQSTLGTTQP